MLTLRKFFLYRDAGFIVSFIVYIKSIRSSPQDFSSKYVQECWLIVLNTKEKLQYLVGLTVTLSLVLISIKLGRQHPPG